MFECAKRQLLMNTFRVKPSADKLAIFLCCFTDKRDKKPEGRQASVMTQALLSVISTQTVSFNQVSGGCKDEKQPL